ncbi:MAG: YbhB/YbcL family Raf kinase inhibitor-like protein [Candidatus Aenigmatarchaeota archaeon]|nr:MAG: YbhB/YbcL family Raf kinase inhibitor-like protein [Candidatus Aenigmarchaeota archaeon]
MGELRLTSPAFTDNSMIPAKFTCQGEDVNPQLDIGGAPGDVRSFVLIMDDPDAPMGTWDHWVVFNIPPETTTIQENSVPAGAVQGRNSWGNSEWGGPCPPSGVHRYVFKLYALDSRLELDHSATKADVENAMKAHILSEATLTGMYQKS